MNAEFELKKVLRECSKANQLFKEGVSAKDILQDLYQNTLKKEREFIIKPNKTSERRLEYMKRYRANKTSEKRLLNKKQSREAFIKEKFEYAKENRNKMRCYTCKKYVTIIKDNSRYVLEDSKKNKAQKLILENNCPFCLRKLRSYGGLIKFVVVFA